MDIYCKHCGEPWDLYELHEAYDDDNNKLTFQEAAARFADLGCGALTLFTASHKCQNEMVDPEAAARAKILQELSPHPDEWIGG